MPQRLADRATAGHRDDRRRPRRVDRAVRRSEPVTRSWLTAIGDGVAGPAHRPATARTIPAGLRERKGDELRSNDRPIADRAAGDIADHDRCVRGRQLRQRQRMGFAPAQAVADRAIGVIEIEDRLPGGDRRVQRRQTPALRCGVPTTECCRGAGRAAHRAMLAAVFGVRSGRDLLSPRRTGRRRLPAHTDYRARRRRQRYRHPLARATAAAATSASSCSMV